MGQKIHYGENGKTDMQGAAYGNARFGYSGMIVVSAAIAIKKLLTIHDQIYLEILLLFCSLLLYRYFICFLKWHRHLKNVKIFKIAFVNCLIFYQGQIQGIFLIIFILFRLQCNNACF